MYIKLKKDYKHYGLLALYYVAHLYIFLIYKYYLLYMLHPTYSG